MSDRGTVCAQEILRDTSDERRTGGQEAQNMDRHKEEKRESAGPALLK